MTASDLDRLRIRLTQTRLRRSPGRWSRLQTRLPRREGWRRANCSLPRIRVKCIMGSICLSLHEYLHVINSSNYQFKPPFKDPILPVMHCTLAIIGSHFLDVEKSENSCWSLKSVCMAYVTLIALLLCID